MTVSEPQSMAELPKYKCHKEVWALKIQAMRVVPGTTEGAWHLFPAEDGYGPIQVDQEYMVRHKPQLGGYYVVYEDGYRSYSPAVPFEAGYTRL